MTGDRWRTGDDLTVHEVSQVVLRAAQGTYAAAGVGQQRRHGVQPAKPRWWEWFQAFAAVLALWWLPGSGAYLRSVLVRLVLIGALLAGVVWLWNTAARDECAQVGRLGGYEWRYEPVLSVFPGNCWVRFPLESPADDVWMPADSFVMGGQG